MWKQARESGLSLAELLVVLAITVVLAAILLPAINTPNHGVEPASRENLDAYVAAVEVDMPPTSRHRDDRSDERDQNAPVADDRASSSVPPAEVLPAFNTSRGQTLERDGLKEFKTTDISYKLP